VFDATIITKQTTSKTRQPPDGFPLRNSRHPPLMSLSRLLRFLLPTTLLLCVLPLAMNASHYQHFKVAVYIRAYEVLKMKDPEWLRSQWAIVEAQVKVDKVYIETHRDLIIIDDETLRAVKAFFAAKGIEAAAGIATVRNERNLFEVFCYTQKSHRDKIREIVEASARNFDEIIIDDFFFTTCSCDECVAAKGAKTWSQYRLELMTDVSKDLVLAAARAVNPKVRVVLKYPNWYEHFHGSGYNLETQPPLFDGIYTGTETRDPATTGQHLQQYHSYSIMRYLESISPGRNGGGWVDTGARGQADRYAEQLWITLLGKAREITLFAFHELLEPYRPSDRAAWQGQGGSFDYDRALAGVPKGITPTLASTAGQALAGADAVLGALGSPVGMASYRPFHSTGDDFLHSYLGNAGVPVELQASYPAQAPLIFLAESAKADPEIVPRIGRSLREGRTVAITAGLLRALQDRGLREIAEIGCNGRGVLAESFGAWGFSEAAPQPLLLPQVQYLTNEAWDLLSARSGPQGFPLVLSQAYGKGRLLVIAIPENPADLYRIPPHTLSRLREFLSVGLPVRLEGPSLVSLFLYHNGSLVVESFHDEPVEITVVCPAGTRQLEGLAGAATLSPSASDDKAARFTLTLPPHSFRGYVRRK